jgi:predicted MFS family arabinose efflux permease
VRKSAGPSLLDPKLMAMGYQVGQAIGWRRIASLAAVGLLAAGLTREWLSHRQDVPQADSDTAPQP